MEEKVRERKTVWKRELHLIDGWIALQFIVSHCLSITDITTGTCVIEQKQKNASLLEATNLANQQLTVIC